MFEKLIELRRDLHKNAEGSNKEFETTKKVMSFLKGFGIESDHINKNEKLGLYGDIGSGYPLYILRADLDALPMIEESGLEFSSKTNFSHSCGHDIHTSALCGAGVLLKEIEDELKGRVRLLFQQGEETYTGADLAIEAGLLEKASGIIALHTWPELPVGVIGFKKGPIMAGSALVNIEVKGKGGHAARPEEAVDTIVASAYILAALQTAVSRNIPPRDESILSFGKLEAGTAFNILPESAYIEGTARVFSDVTMKIMGESVKRIAKYQAKSFGAEAIVEFNPVVGPVINDDELVDAFEEEAKKIFDYKGIHYLDRPSTGSEDFAKFLEYVPGAVFRLGTHNDDKRSHLPLHHPGIIFDEKAIETGAIFLTEGIKNLLL